MYGGAALAETSISESVPTGVPIIPEVATETKQLVLVIEIDLVYTG